ncbi:MAG: GNAT family N-acetyltransferase [Deltaproteobacteria bacterium]|nr:GNAT family N-acetyltransferase [Deltaproteobacteria bacterium]
MPGSIKARAMRYEDLDDIIQIDSKILGHTRPEFWRMKMELAEKRSMISLVAETEGRIVGFILSETSDWEYGVPAMVGWLDTIGVLPEFRKKGIANLLATEMINALRKLGVKKIYTMVDWRSLDMLKFFNSLGFNKGELINLELDI